MQKLSKIQLQTISTCSANCVFCPFAESWHKDNPGKMEHKLFKKLMKELEEAPEFKTFCPYLMNEPLMDTRVLDWCKEFYDMYPDKTIELSCNPSYLTEKNIKKIHKVFKDHDHSIPISFHGINELTLDYVMRLPFKQSLNNVIKLLQIGADDLNISIRGAGMSMDGKILYFNQPDYFRTWSQYMQSYGIKPDKVQVQYFNFHDRAGQITREERNANKNHYGVVRESLENFYCPRVDRVLHVLWNGDIAMCCMDYKKEVPIEANLNDMTISEWYESDEYLKIAGQILGKIETKEDFICKRCISPGG